MKGHWLVLLWPMATLATACNNDASCGAANAAGNLSLVALASNAEISYENFKAAANNDCPTPGSETAITIQGTQLERSFPLVLCLSEPENISDTEMVTLDDGRVRLIDVSADLGEGCTLELSRNAEPSLQATFEGYCQNGLGSAGFGLTLEGSAAGIIRCPGMEPAVQNTQIQFTAASAVAVTPELPPPR